MDKKKKFFIGLGILTIIYMATISLNLTHNDESDSSENSKSEYSKENVMKLIKTDYSDYSDTIKQWFSFVLPKFDVFREAIFTDYCTVKNDAEDYILLNKKQDQCVLFVKKSKESARLASLSYEIMSNQAERALNTNKHNSKSLTSVPLRHKLVLSKSQLATFPLQTDQANKKNKISVLMVFIKDIDQSFYQYKNPDKKKTLLSNFPPEKDKERVSFNEVDNKFSLTVPKKGGVFVLKCSNCNKHSIKIRTAD